METTPASLAHRYTEALAAQDMATVAGMFAEGITWHQPGDNRFSGTHHGSAAVGEMIGGMMAASQGSFALAPNGTTMVNSDLVAIPVHFAAKRDEAELSMDGVDVLRVDGDHIVEVWLFTADQRAEDDFWGRA